MPRHDHEELRATGFNISLPITISFGAGMHVSRIFFTIGFDAGVRLTRFFLTSATKSNSLHVIRVSSQSFWLESVIGYIGSINLVLIKISRLHCLI